MKLTRLLDDTNVTYALSLDQRQRRAILASLKIAGFKPDVNRKDVSNIIDIILAQANRVERYNPLKAAVAKTNLENTCPICGKDMEDVTIANNKNAKYCPDHNLTLPIQSK